MKHKPCLLQLVPYETPILRVHTEKVAFPLNAEDQALIEDMKFSILPEQLEKAGAPWKEAIGMAANQWGINRSIFLYYLDEGDGYQLEVVINPHYEPLSEQTMIEEEWEGCFSVPLALGKIKRYKQIKVTYQNEIGQTIHKNLEGYAARVFQHETDHLKGQLYDDPNSGRCVQKESFTSIEEVMTFRTDHPK